MKELTKKQKIFVLKEMIRYYENVSFSHCSMCFVMNGILITDFKLDEHFFELDEVFLEFYKGMPTHYGYWFEFGKEGKEKRLQHCKKILKLIESK